MKKLIFAGLVLVIIAITAFLIYQMVVLWACEMIPVLMIYDIIWLFGAKLISEVEDK